VEVGPMGSSESVLQLPVEHIALILATTHTHTTISDSAANFPA